MASVKKRAGYGWEVRYIDPATGRRPSKTFELKKDAETFKRKVEREIEDGMHVSPGKAKTVGEVIDEHLAYRQTRVIDGRLGPERAYNVEGQLRKHVIPAIGRLPWRDVTAARVEAIYRSLVGARALRASYARSIIGSLRMVEVFALKRGYTKAQPVDEALNELRGIPKARIKALSIESTALVLRLALEHRRQADHRTEAMLACFVHLAGCCGMRVGEIIALRREHLDLEVGTIRVRHNMTITGRLKSTKSEDGKRDLALPDHLRAMLAAWLSEFYVANERDLVFTTRQGIRRKHADINKGWHSLLDRAGLLVKGDAYHFHALRHFAGSWWLKNGMSIPDVSKLLGHSDPAFTMRTYIHALSLEDARADAMRSNATLLIAAPGALLPSFSDARVTQSHLNT